MRLDSDDVRHLAALARVGMTDEEIEIMRDQMSNIMENFDVLNQVNTDDVEPTGHSVGLVSVMREDEVAESSTVEQVLANAPAQEDNFVRVRAVLE